MQIELDKYYPIQSLRGKTRIFIYSQDFNSSFVAIILSTDQISRKKNKSKFAKTIKTIMIPVQYTQWNNVSLDF